MSTARNAAEALRKIHSFIDQRPKEYQMNFYLALEDLSKRLKFYAEELPSVLDAAYNIRCRQKNWFPVPFSRPVLSEAYAGFLQVERASSADAILSIGGFKVLQAAAEEAGVELTLCVRPDGASVICNFLAETPGEARLVFI